MSNRRISPTGVAASTEIPDCHDSDVQGLPRSALRDFTRRLTFVPAGHGLSRPLKLRALTDTTYFYIDPRGPPADSALRFGKIEFNPRLEALGNVLADRTSNYFPWQYQNETTCTGANHPCTLLHKPYTVIASASPARAASIALSRASGPKANFSARTKAILVMPIKPNRFRR
jgi:hypothetical protein